MARYAKYAYLGAYLCAPNMVKWGVPEKILQNTVQTCPFWPLASGILALGSEEKMPNIDTLEALGDEMTSILNKL